MKTTFPHDLAKARELSPGDDGVALNDDDLISFAELDDLVLLAKTIYRTGAAFISIMGRHYQWFLAENGVNMHVSPSESSICRLVVHERGQCYISDTHNDADLRTNPFVTGDHRIRFYAGVPIRIKRADNDAEICGAFCIADTAPRLPGAFDDTRLRALARIAETLIQARITRSCAIKAMQEQTAAVEKLHRNEKLFGAVERMADMGTWRYDIETKKTTWSRGVYGIYGLPVTDEAPFMDTLSNYPPEDRKRVEALMRHTIITGEPFDAEFDFRTQSGSKKRVRAVGEVERKNGRSTSIVGLLSDVTAQYAMQKALHKKALTDPLTGLPNRAGFHMHIGDVIARAAGAGHLALMVVDLDGFKLVNDRAGHLAGDRALTECANIIQHTVGENGFAARYGGDEFVIVLDGPDIRALSEEIAARVAENLSFDVPGAGANNASLRLGATVGIAYNRAGDAVHDIIHRADIAMYEAKRARPGSVKVSANV